MMSALQSLCRECSSRQSEQTTVLLTILALAPARPAIGHMTLDAPSRARFFRHACFGVLLRSRATLTDSGERCLLRQGNLLAPLRLLIAKLMKVASAAGH